MSKTPLYSSPLSPSKLVSRPQTWSRLSPPVRHPPPSGPPPSFPPFSSPSCLPPPPLLLFLFSSAASSHLPPLQCGGPSTFPTSLPTSANPSPFCLPPPAGDPSSPPSLPRSDPSSSPTSVDPLYHTNLPLVGEPSSSPPPPLLQTLLLASLRLADPLPSLSPSPSLCQSPPLPFPAVANANAFPLSNSSSPCGHFPSSAPTSPPRRPLFRRLSPTPPPCADLLQPSHRPSPLLLPFPAVLDPLPLLNSPSPTGHFPSPTPTPPPRWPQLLLSSLPPPPCTDLLPLLLASLYLADPLLLPLLVPITSLSSSPTSASPTLSSSPSLR